MANRTKSWRSLLADHGPAFLDWMDETDGHLSALEHISLSLERYLQRRLTSKNEAVMFWKRVPEVRDSCDDQATYEKPLAAEAYAYVHLLDRYWRTWQMLCYLIREKMLPMGDNRLEVLDVGTGPGPTVYALQDFYEKLGAFASVRDEALLRQNLVLTLVEVSDAFNKFLHSFGECGIGRGPYGADLRDPMQAGRRKRRGFGGG